MDQSDLDFAPPAGWLESYEHVEGYQAAGPAKHQRVGVLKVGDRKADKVLVLLGGREGGSNVFRYAARALALQVDSLQVWAVDRREQNLADLGGFKAVPDKAVRTYLDGEYRAEDGESAGFAAEWGLEVLLEDLRRVVAEAGAGGRQVVLGGVSIGAAAALQYAAWDFDGSPGFADLAGLVSADGGVRTAFKGAGMEFDLPLAGAQGWLAQVKGGAVFENATSTAVGLGERPQDAAIWYQLAAQQALANPHGLAILADRLPEAWRTDRPLTNAGLFGRLVDASTAHPAYSVHAGHLAENGDWIDGGCTPLGTVAAAFAGPEPGAFLWYTLNRVMLDFVAANDLVETEVTDFLGLRPKHAQDINVPLYAFQTGLTNGTAGQAAAALVADSRIPELVLYGDGALAHQDLTYARWEHNRFIRTLASFLQTLPGGKR
jgi:hypothetical protein